MAEKQWIRRIKDSNQDEWKIYASQAELADNSTALGGHTYAQISASIAADITNKINSVVETYVVTKNSSDAGYKGIAEFTITLASLQADCGTSNSFNVGDVILNKTTSLPDWWISNISGTTITLSPLETQSIDHKHSITRTSGSALSSVTPTSTTVAVAKVGSEISVADGALTATDAFSTSTVLTSITHSGNVSGTVTTTLATGTSTDYGHSHTVTDHSHSGSYAHTIVSETGSAITGVATATMDIHSHSIVSVAGPASNDTAITYVYDKSGSATFIKTLKDAATTTATGGATPETNSVADHKHSITIASKTFITSVAANTGNNSTGTTAKANTAGLATNAPVLNTSTTVDTGSATHSHTFTGGTTSASVVVSINTAATTGTKYVTGGNTGNVLNSFTATVDASTGVLSFTTTSTNAYTSLTSTYMSISYAKVGVTGTISGDGAHTHNMNHSHSIPSHTHSIDAHSHAITVTSNATLTYDTTNAGEHSHTVNDHTHTYYKTVASATGGAITGVSTSTYTPHKHAISVISVANCASGSVTVATGSNDSATFVKTVKDETKTLTTGVASDNTTSTAYIKATSTPALTLPAPTAKFATLHQVGVTPATAYGKVVESVGTSSITVITSVSGNTGGKV